MMLPDLSRTVQALFFDAPSVDSDPNGVPAAGMSERVDCVARLPSLPTASSESTNGRKAGEWSLSATTVATRIGSSWTLQALRHPIDALRQAAAATTQQHKMTDGKQGTRRVKHSIRRAKVRARRATSLVVAV